MADRNRSRPHDVELVSFIEPDVNASPEEEDPDMDVYIFDYEDSALENYKTVHPGESEDTGGLKYSDPETGSHFEFVDICKRLNGVQKLRKNLDQAWGLDQYAPKASS